MALAKNIYLPRTLVTKDIESRLPYEVIPVGYGVAAPMASIVQHGNVITMSAVLTAATIYYTTDGNDPTTSSAVYSAPFSITGGELIKALVVKEGYDNSNVVSLQTRQFKVATPYFEISVDNKVKIFVDTEDAVIHYTTDGTIPDEDSETYASEVQFTGVGVVKAIAIRENWQDSDIAISRTIYEGLEERLEAIEDIVGTTPLTTTAAQVTDAVNELNDKVTDHTADIANLNNSQLMQDEEIVALGNIKADKDGNYSLMHVGTADNLAGKGDSSPAEFTYRTTGGTSDVSDGTASIKKIQGNSIVWNQLVKIADESKTITESGVTITDNRDGSYTISTAEGGATADVTLDLHPHNAEGNLAGRKYLEMGINGGSADTYLFGNGYSELTGNGAIYNPAIFTAGDALINIRLYVMEGAVLDNVVVRPQLIDLTKMFGAGNEPNSVADFKALYPLDYYAHNEGEIVSFNGTKIKSVGFNAYNHATGTAEILGGHEYQITGTYTSLTFGGEAVTPDSNGIFEVAKNGTLTISGGNSTDTCVHLVWSGIRNGEYEPYSANERALPIAKINTDGTITDSEYEKTRLFPNGLLRAGSVHDEITNIKAIKRVGIINLGELSWNVGHAYSNNYFYSAPIQSAKSSGLNVICRKYATNSIQRVNAPEKIISGESLSNIKNINIVDSSFSDVTTFKNAMNGVFVYYALENPIEVTFSDSINLSYQVSDFGTEQIIPDNEDEPTTAPFVGSIVYGMNAVDFIRRSKVNFISKESMENFIAAFNELGVGTIDMNFDCESQEYEFEATPAE